MFDERPPRYRHTSRSRSRSRSPSSRSPRPRRDRDRDRDEADRDTERSLGQSWARSRSHYDSSLPYDDDQTDSRDRPARSPRRSGPGRPSSTVIVEGLPNDATKDDILDGFASLSPDLKVFNAENVKSVRLRNNKRGRRIGFVEFFSTNDAAHFVEYHYPRLELQLAHSRGVDSEPVIVGINYSHSRDDDSGGASRDDRGKDGEDWKCPECSFINYGSRNRCHRCRAARSGGRDDYAAAAAAAYGPKLTGETDECPQQFPSQYLVIRGLDPSIDEERFADGVKKLYVEVKQEPAKRETQNKLKSTAPTANTASLGAKPESLRRVFLVRDRHTDEAMRYGFAEFASLEDAQGAIAKFKAAPNMALFSKPVSVAFIHAGVFVPHTGRVTEENSRYIFNPIYNKDILLKYWDNRVYPSILKVAEDHAMVVEQQQQQQQQQQDEHENTEEITTVQDASGKKIKKFKLGQGAVKPAVVMGPQLQMWAKKRAELAAAGGGGGGGSGSGIADRMHADDSVESSPAPSERLVSSKRRTKDTYTSFGDPETLVCALCMRRFESLVALRDHEALSAEHQANRTNEERRRAAAEQLRAMGTKPRLMTFRVASALRQQAAAVDSNKMYTSYADRDKLQCLVCQRKFTKAAVLSLHERESEMHRLNITDQGNIERAISQLARMGKTPRKMVAKTKDGSQQYRDRARERRQVYNQPNAPRRKQAAAPPPVPELAASHAPAPSKGAALLGKMGWTAGEGLGAERAGRTDVIATDVYAAGVGLGAEGGKIGDAATEAARKTKGDYSDFIEVTRNKARERYEKMGG